MQLWMSLNHEANSQSAEKTDSCYGVTTSPQSEANLHCLPCQCHTHPTNTLNETETSVQAEQSLCPSKQRQLHQIDMQLRKEGTNKENDPLDWNNNNNSTDEVQPWMEIMKAILQIS